MTSMPDLGLPKCPDRLRMNQPCPTCGAKGHSPCVAPAASQRVFPVTGDSSWTLAAFTPKELDVLRTVCRDSDNELGIRALNAGLARGGK